ncbi:MAG: carbohydrate ABC transporter permease [Candidatus Omnitrophica bacterium]|nr:carbohydrate ABC transporter permease [Candidatus Omnitrophota bacterium]
MYSVTQYRAKRFGLKLVMQLFCAGVAATCLFPLFWMAASSLKTQETVFSDFSLLPSNPQWLNYVNAWTKGGFGVYFLNSIFYSTVVVVGIVLISSLAAYAFARLRFPGRQFFFILFLATMMIPIPGAFIALYVLLNKLGLINTHWGYILPQINGGLALSIFLLKTFFEKLPKDLEDSARIDGCTKWGIYWHLAMPLAKPAIAVVVIFNVLAVWNEYLLAMLVLTDKELMPLQRGLMVFQGAHITQYPLLMAGMTISVIPIVVVYLLMQRYIIEGITAGAIKG